jgi:hypothetical protein
MIRMVTKRSMERADELVDGERQAAAWCRLAAPVPALPPAVRQAVGKRRLRHRRRPLPYVFVAVSTVLTSPLLLLAVLEGGNFSDIKKARRAKKERRVREAEIPRLGLDRAFDGDWDGTAGQLLLRWYEQAPDRERLSCCRMTPSRCWRRPPGSGSAAAPGSCEWWGGSPTRVA